MTGFFEDRPRTNLLRKPEQKTILYLVARVPRCISPDILTLLGLTGSLMVLTGFFLASSFHRDYLLLGITGLGLNWFGDSLDGRIAYFRNKPRKWYGFALDIIVDWLSTVLIGLGYLIYAKDLNETLAFFFVVLYGWSMIISQLRFKITDKYSIDSGLVGPTELRVLIALILAIEIFVEGSIHYFALLLCAVLFVINVADSIKLLRLGNKRDNEERNFLL